jgi:hypothetical protein
MKKILFLIFLIQIILCFKTNTYAETKSSFLKTLNNIRLRYCSYSKTIYLKKKRRFFQKIIKI